MRKNNREHIELSVEINYNGNWNRKYPNLPIVYGKPISIIYLDNDNFVWTHDEIIKLIDCYLQADKESIEMINNKNINTGNITKSEISFKDKLLNFLNKELDEWR